MNKKYCFGHKFHTYSQKHYDYFIHALPIHFLSVPYNLRALYYYGQTAPVKERHI